jgi:hypothetical protein
MKTTFLPKHQMISIKADIDKTIRVRRCVLNKICGTAILVPQNTIDIRIYITYTDEIHFSPLSWFSKNKRRLMRSPCVSVCASVNLPPIFWKHKRGLIRSPCVPVCAFVYLPPNFWKYKRRHTRSLSCVRVCVPRSQLIFEKKKN